MVVYMPQEKSHRNQPKMRWSEKSKYLQKKCYEVDTVLALFLLVSCVKHSFCLVSQSQWISTVFSHLLMFVMANTKSLISRQVPVSHLCVR